MWRAKVARVAKRVTLQTAETKCYSYQGINSASGGTQLPIALYSGAGGASGVARPYVDYPLEFIDNSTQKFGRVGNEVILKGIQFHITLQQDPNNVYESRVRMMLAWIDPNLTPTTLTNALLLENPAATGNDVTNAFVTGPTRPNTVFRKILFDRVYTLRQGNNPVGASTNIPAINTKTLRLNIPMHNQKYQFISSTVGIGGEKMDLVLITWAYAAGVANTVPVVNMLQSVRVYYKDP